MIIGELVKLWIGELVRGQKSEVRGQKLQVRCYKLDVRN